MTHPADLGEILGTYQSDAVPLWVSLALHLPWVKGRLSRRAVTELRIHEHGVMLVRHADARDSVLAYGEIRRIWFERFLTGSEHEGHTSFRLDLIAENLDTLFTLTRVDCAPDDPVLLLMEQLYQRWKAATWRHYHVVAAVVTMTAQEARRTDLAPLTPVFLCMQKGQTRYDYTAYHWEFPGGKFEQGEDGPQALRRELQEEMAYDVSVTRHLTTIEHRYRDFGITLECYLCTATTPDFERREHNDHRWLTPEEMSHLAWCEADRPVLDCLTEG